jgi:CubicO group peptidase (beta-lactamase class C family)
VSVEVLFHRQLERGAFPGGQLVVRVQGREVLNLAAGLASGFRGGDDGPPVAVTATTRFQVLSASKPVIALAIAVLEDRGLLDVTRPVADYVPEFADAGKQAITVLDVLTHRSGMVVPRLWSDPHLWTDWQQVQEEIWKAPPRYRRGTIAYQPWEFGSILAEVVRRAAGTALPEFLRSIDPKLGATLPFMVGPAEVPSVARSYWLGRPQYRLGGQDVASRFEEINNAPDTLTSLVPGASMPTTATALAEFYEVILRGGITESGDRLLSRETLETYLLPAVRGFDRSSRSYVVLGRGFIPGWRGPQVYGWWGSRSCVGHPGGFCSVAFCDRRAGVAAAIVTNGNRGFGDLLRRFAPLDGAIRREFAR